MTGAVLGQGIFGVTDWHLMVHLARSAPLAFDAGISVSRVLMKTSDRQSLVPLLLFSAAESSIPFSLIFVLQHFLEKEQETA